MELHIFKPILTRQSSRVQQSEGYLCVENYVFQSSPSNQAGCNNHGENRTGEPDSVSILTQQSSWVQRQNAQRYHSAWNVSILTQQSSWVQRHALDVFVAAVAVSILTQQSSRVQPQSWNPS
ncbi:hypothetical protein EDD73_1267 [Heliophilum fasciatum]|uniref:Uncharacterized protein n=1 Tax=Heliophilum fasciatum TaxID=35700 RepID=A0A4V2SWC4_9FIRM|nr:hypothetical protein EDD73_1267 [Heliophilum fasciatum]